MSPMPAMMPVASQPLIQPMMQPMVQPMMQPMVQPMMQPMVPTNLPLLVQGSNVMPTMAATTGLVSPPLVPVTSGFPMQSKTSFDGSKPNTPDSAKTVIRASSVSSHDSP